MKRGERVRAEFNQHKDPAKKPEEVNEQMEKTEKTHVKTKKNSFPNPTQPGNYDVAIIGMACRFPGAGNYEEFWENLKQGRSSIREVPPERWDWKAYWGDPQKEVNKTNSKWGGFLTDVDAFDPGFFGLSPREAEAMDPQQRIMLELSWSCFEDAGICPSWVAGEKIGVYIGVFNLDYKQLQEKESRVIETYYSTGTAFGIIPNRISHYFNLKGPSFPIDTACSSSLNAIHSAIQSLHYGECKMALVGGISLLLTPTRHISFSKTGMLSPTGSCKTFDEKADGYVRSEGAGLILLKPLKQALEDGDSIYGVIKGSAVNHNGKTHTITYPNPEAQAEVIVDAFQRAGITSDSISYIEAHGTGTPKGDPMEFEGLLRAFQFLAAQEDQLLPKNYCGLGSVKTNIGHMEPAAGIAGVIKVLLSMNYQQLPGLPNFQKLNHRIAIQDSPFYIVDHLIEWKLPEGKNKQTLPRRAGVSSFGFGGTNAHVILEEAPATPKYSSRKLPGYLICLSAKTEEALRRKEEELALWLEKKGPTKKITDISATLLFGREHFSIRAACVVRDLPELRGKLEEVLEKGQAEGYFREKKAKKEQPQQSFFKELGEGILKGFRVGAEINEREYRDQLTAFAKLYVKGYDLDWKALSNDHKVRRIGLPTYPFARERYWAPVVGAYVRANNYSPLHSPLRAPIHPLLHQNTSDLSEQRFSSTFTGQEFFLADHLVKGERVLPGVAYLEMVRAAVEQAVRASGKGGLRLKNVVWTRPIVVVDQPVQVHIGLFPEGNEEIGYEIYSLESEVSGGEPVVHGQGSVASRPSGEAPSLNLKLLQAQCQYKILSSAQCYEAFQTVGISYGPGHRGIENLWVGPGQVLAKLTMPSSVSGTHDQFVLHPSLMDSALQAALMINHKDLQLSLPFALEELEIFDRGQTSMWALIRYSEGSQAGNKVEKLDLDLSDDQGKVCVRMKGFSFRVLGEGDSAGSLEAPVTLMLHPRWEEQTVAQETSVPAFAERVVMLCEVDNVSPEKVEARLNGGRCLKLQTEWPGIVERFQDYAVQVFEEIQIILKEHPQGMVLIQIVLSNQQEQQIFSGLLGLLKTARLENPKLVGQLIEVEPGEDFAGIVTKLTENSRGPIANRIRYQDGKRWVAGWSEIETAPESLNIPWKDRGIYLITGGTGGLGLIFAGEIARKVKDVILILVGRSPLTAEKQSQLQELETRGARIVYKQADLTQKKAVNNLIKDIRKNFGKLDGIIHSAGVIHDNFILKKTREELREVLAPKVAGMVYLDQASKDLELDFFVLFSSIAGSLGNPGQADYSAANAFMDAYATYRNALVASEQRHGQTLSINWPLWKEGGMRVDVETEKMMAQSMGTIPMGTSTGIRALYRGLSSSQAQIMVMEGKLTSMRRTVLSMTCQTAFQPQKTDHGSSPVTGIDPVDLPYKVQAILMRIVSKLLKVKLEDLDAETKLSDYGFDSITFTEFANQLNEEYRLGLTPTIFFEYPTLRGFSDYLIEEHQTVFAAHFGGPAGVEKPAPVMEDQPEESSFQKRRRSRFAQTGFLGSKSTPSAVEPVAIIGMSGLFPMARDLEEFWRNLAQGRDCITEIPRDRWDWREYYGDPTTETNKTNIKWGAFIDGVAEFDPLFFGISPREAELMDPQQRLLMTYVWKAIEDAGVSPQSLSGTKTGIFVGTWNNGYGGLISQANIAVEGYSSTGIVPSVGPNRMSYFLNLHGPSEPIETACSSSLVAIHRAVTAMENGTCEMAIVGGINTIVTPELHLSFNKAGMLAEDGRCKTFSNLANGYVRGEGVGMLFLKKLKDAEQAGDHIYGIIRGTAENHGGRANSLTAPNLKAQAELLVTAYTKAGIDPRTVSYIEAHGTGTKLGDPVEIDGLKAAFKELYQITGSSQVTGAQCGLGSVKTNIGHLELAAGIAGVIKVLLQLKNKTLTPSLHSDPINPYIQLEGSPFYIVREKMEWKPLQDAEGKDLPRRAGVSSFGFGGVNAHVVIEEYIPSEKERSPLAVTPQDPAIIVLSARNEDRLKDQARQLLASIEEQPFSDADLSGMAYTLQVGREAMEERLALLAVSIKELVEKLWGFLEGRAGIVDLFRGHVKPNQETMAVFAVDEELREAVAKWVQRQKYGKILDLWVKGLTFDWNQLYGTIKPRRISLPTYPFARERYWLPVGANNYSPLQATIHPLLHQNTSDLSEQRFSSTFTGREFFLADHVVKGERVLPGAAYLEMARAAVEQAMGTSAGHRAGFRLKNVVWIRPITVGEHPVRVHIGLYPEENGIITYQIYTGPGGADQEPIVHSEGIAVLSPAPEVPAMDLQVLQAGCNQGSLSPSQCYEVFRSMGINYGPGHQGLAQVNLGVGQVLAKLFLPSSVSHTEGQFVLHPTLIDAALQASLGLQISSGDRNLSLPFSLQELEILSADVSPEWALVRSGDPGQTGDKIRKFDIDFCDQHGTVQVRIKGLSSINTGNSLDEIQAVLRQIVSQLLKVPSNALDLDTEFEEYGFDQVLLIQLADTLNREYRLELNPTLFFEHSTLNRFAEYLAKEHADVFTKRFEAKSGNPSSAEKTGQTAPAVTQDLPEEKTLIYFKKLLSFVIKLPVDQIDVDAPLEKYGIDSVMAMQLINQLEKVFGSLSKTLFFEYQTIRQLTGYFREAYHDQLTELMGIGEKATATIENGSLVRTTPVKSAISNRKSRFATLSTASREGISTGPLDIAIIGVSGRYPQAGNICEFWKNLRDGKDCITEIPKDRWDHSLYFDMDKSKPGKTYGKWGGFLEGVDRFDPLFFNIAPREAEIMDPQERIFLECVFATLEDAGYTRDSLGSRQGADSVRNVGVYVGVMYEEYQLYGAQEQLQGRSVALSGNPASIANRVSYFFNFQGPSMAIDTMCSSSLTALHLACESLQRGECELAIAGGVNVSLHPNKYLFLGQGKFISSKGRCESFGQGGDGYVPGEGVGAVLLKPLSKAIEDHDHIYGIIKGTAVNHGGKTNGYTVPNPNAQAEVIGRALKEARIDPRTISYLEAHGTGTSLGDPIEITGLVKAFREYTEDQQFCAIGSAKSNIGHCESAAGIAGLTKVLLQFQYGLLAPSLHSQVLNPNIDFRYTPFIVQQELTEWGRPNVNGLEVPRRAGVSSFGAGGSNAHIVLEEYLPPAREQLSNTMPTSYPAMIVLSARNEDRLREQARQLLSAFQEREFSDADLVAIAYTLQVGREAMEERLAMTAGSLKELQEKLWSFLEGQDGFIEFYRGQAKRDREALAVLAADEEMRETIEKWVQRGKYGKLLELWVKGLAVDWNILYGAHTHSRISLPTYPFARERYWAPVVGANNYSPQRAPIHPLLHQNTSDLSEQRFSSTFTGREIFLTDHVVKGQRVLSGAAQLEMARAAVIRAAGVTEEGRIGLRLKNITWVRPIMVEDQPVQVHLGLYPEANGEISYEIYGGSEGTTAEPLVYSQGWAVLVPISKAPALDLQTLRARCTQGILSSAQCYEAFQAMGIDYGPVYRGIESIYLGGDLLLAKLSIPVAVSDPQEQFILNPSLLDSAMQAPIGFVIGPADSPAGGGIAPLKSFLPYTLQELEIFGGCTSPMWALIRHSEGRKTGNQPQKLDIDLCDEQGTVGVRIKGYTFQVLEGDLNTVETRSRARAVTSGTLMLKVCWKEQAITGAPSEAPAYTKHLVMLCEPGEVSRESIETQMNDVAPVCQCLSWQSEREGIDQRFQTYAVQSFEAIQSLLKEKPTGRVLIQMVIFSHPEQQLFRGLTGLLKTAQLENTKLTVQLIEVEPGEDNAGLIAKLKENSRSPSDRLIRYQDGRRMVAGWSEMEVPQEGAGLPWKDGGIYLITGGAGGLGLIFAGEIAQKVKNASLILTGRSPLRAEKQIRLQELKGARVTYRQVDVTDRKAVTGLIQSIGEEFGGLDGIIHSAGVIRDNFIIKKTVEEFLEVLGPKITGLVNLDQATQDLNLDFFVLFSSIAGGLGNPGQADYATANAFMDAYSGYRNVLAASNRRRGRTLAINWPLWKEGGMRINPETEKLMTENTGMSALSTGAGIQTWYQTIASGLEQVMVLEGNLPRLREKLLSAGSLLPSKQEKGAAVSSATSEVDRGGLREKVQEILTQTISQVLKVKVEEIDADTRLNEYGFDSVTLTEFANKLNQKYKLELIPTVFYDHPTIHGFAKYLVEEHQAVFAAQFAVTDRTPVSVPITENKAEVAPELKSRRSRFAQTKAWPVSETAPTAEPVAVIGMSGIFPKARGLHEFWKNLREGRDCITEIPKDRWDWREYYGNPSREPNKTNIKWGGFIDGVAEFDPLFFGISPREAELMDPQQRLFLENCWHCIEDSGLNPASLSGSRCGVFVGCGGSMYGELLGEQGLNAEGLMGNTSSVLAARISYFLNLKGPCLAIDTACSSSVVAIAEACYGLLLQTCDLALAGGVSVSTPAMYLKGNDAGMLSPDGRSFTFDARANGFVPGEGVGVVLLKRLSNAVRDQDPIYGVIRGWGINQDGKTNGITAPSVNSQILLEKEVYERFRIDPETISLVEAHGTGTKLGDPIEVEALTASFQAFTGKKNYCALGTVKSNIGHLLAAAGIAGLIKVLLAIQHRKLPPTLHYETVNQHLSLQNSPFYINTRLRPWEVAPGTPRRAALSSFGFSGTNAHLVIEEYLPEPDTSGPTVLSDTTNPIVLVLSAKSQEQLKVYVERLKNYIESQPDLNLTDLAYTLQVGREAMDNRLAFVAGSREAFLKTLEGLINGGQVAGLFTAQAKKNKGGVGVLETDEDGQSLLQTWLQKGKLDKIAEMWVNGLKIDWNKLYGETKPRRISLPPYPFARESYWIPESKKTADRIVSFPNQTNIPDDQPFFEQLIEEVMNETLTVEDAAWEAKRRLELI